MLEFFSAKVLVDILDKVEDCGSVSFAVFWVGELVYEDSRDRAVFAFFIPFIHWFYLDGFLSGFTHE